MPRRPVHDPTISPDRDLDETVAQRPPDLLPPAAGEPEVSNPAEPHLNGADPAPTHESILTIAPDALREIVAAEEARREILREFISRQLKSGTDFGTINSNGRESKPSLFKPGAEKICLLLQLRPKFSADRATLEMAGNPPGLFAYICRLVDGHGNIVGEGRGAAALTEREGWTVNNTIKICEKRAQVDAVLRVAGLSEIFTQDIEDLDQRQALAHEAARTTAAGEATTPRQPGNIARNTYVAEVSAIPAPPAERPTPPAERPTAADRPTPVADRLTPTGPERPAAAGSAGVPTTDGEELCTEAQQRQIRALLPHAGITESELLRSLKITAIGDLPRGKAGKVIERLTQKSQERGDAPPF